jgi:hypothetical protein
MSAFENLNQGWGGAYVAPATATSPIGTESAPAVRSITRKVNQVLTTTPLAASKVFNGPWIDTNQTGDIYASANIVTAGSHNDINNAFQIQGTDDLANTVMLVGSGVNQVGNSVLFNIQTVVPYRYWRVQFTNNAAGGNQAITITAGGFSNPASIVVTQPTSGAFQAAVTSGSNSVNGFADGGSILGTWLNTSASTNVPVVSIGLATSSAPAGGTQTQLQAQRTPNIFTGGQIPAAAGAVPVWSVTPSKKIRVMKYKIEAGEDCTITSGPLPVNVGLAFNFSAFNSGPPYSSFLGYTHRFVAPATVIATGGNLYDSGFIDLGNGVIAGAANLSLYAGLLLPASTGVVNPTWTITSNQWEAQTIGIKTNGSRGVFKLIQQSFASAASTSVSVTIPVKSKSTVVIVARTTNSVTGIPAFSVSSNTAGDTYAASTVTTNASDGTNGSSLCILTTASSIGSSSNAITVAATNSPTIISFLLLEYQGLDSGGGVDAASVGATGNSTSPASGNYTPATAGDLLISCFATSANLSTVPTIGSSFFARMAVNGANGTIAVADNFGVGALAAGVVNVVVCGTEE